MITQVSSFETLLSHPRVVFDCDHPSFGADLESLVNLAHVHRIPISVLDSQPAALISNITVFENLWTPLAWRYGCSPARLRSTLSELLDHVAPELCFSTYDLHSLLPKRPNELSLVQRCSVILIRALLLQPKLILLSPEWLADLLAAEMNSPLLDLMNSSFPQATLAALPSLALMHDPYFDNWAKLSVLSAI